MTDKRPPKVKSSELTILKMVGGNEKKYHRVVDNKRIKEWVGIGWVDCGPADPTAYRDYPEVDHT